MAQNYSGSEFVNQREKADYLQRINTLVADSWAAITEARGQRVSNIFRVLRKKGLKLFQGEKKCKDIFRKIWSLTTKKIFREYISFRKNIILDRESEMLEEMLEQQYFESQF